MSRPPRFAVLLAVIAVASAQIARAQTVCDQLLPLGFVAPAGAPLPGCASQFTVRLGAPGQSGSYALALALPACDNAPCAGLTNPSLFTCAARMGYACCVSVDQTIVIEKGSYAGPLAQGIQNRITDDTDQRLGICHADYSGNGARIARLMSIQAPAAGDTTVRVNGLIPVFVVQRGLVGSVIFEVLEQPTWIRRTSWGRTKIMYH
jgi:hypothetical protein